MYTSSIPTWAPPAPLKRYIILTGYLGTRIGPGQRWPWQRAPAPLVHLHSIVHMSSLPHRNQQDHEAMFRSEIIPNGFLCSYDSVLAVFVISIWKVIQVNNLMLGCSFCFPVKLTKFLKELYYEQTDCV